MYCQPILVMSKICDYLNDNDFVHLTMCCKKFRAYATKYGKLYKFYKQSEIMNSVHKYNFVNIIYDLQSLSIESISKTVENIVFTDIFNGDITPLYQLPNIKSVNVGFEFTDLELVQSIPDKIFERKQ